MNNIQEVEYEDLAHLKDEINLLIVTANDIETFHVRQLLGAPFDYKDVLKVPHAMQTYFIGKFGEYTAVHVQCSDQGSIRASASILTVTNAIDDWQPKAVIMIGVAMGVNEDDQRIGDILVSEAIIPYEVQKLGPKGIIARNETPAPGPILLNRFRNITGFANSLEDEQPSTIIPCHILSGEKLIDNIKERDKILKRHPHAKGAEMEGAGLFAACRNKQLVEWILVKGICDYGDGNKLVDKTRRQNIAAQAAASLCLLVMSSKTGFKAIGLMPAKTSNEQITNSVPLAEKEILEIITPESEMMTPIQTLVDAYLTLNPIQKASVISELGIPLSELTELSAHEMDRDIFKRIKANNLYRELWDAINKVKHFPNLSNPFK